MQDVLLLPLHGHDPLRFAGPSLSLSLKLLQTLQVRHSISPVSPGPPTDPSPLMEAEDGSVSSAEADIPLVSVGTKKDLLHQMPRPHALLRVEVDLTSLDSGVSEFQAMPCNQGLTAEPPNLHRLGS